MEVYRFFGAHGCCVHEGFDKCLSIGSRLGVLQHPQSLCSLHPHEVGGCWCAALLLVVAVIAVLAGFYKPHDACNAADCVRCVGIRARLFVLLVHNSDDGCLCSQPLTQVMLLAAAIT